MLMSSMNGPPSSAPATSPFVSTHANVQHLSSLNTTFIAYNNSPTLSLEARPSIHGFPTFSIGCVTDYTGNNSSSLSDLSIVSSEHDDMGLDLDSAAQLLNALPLPDVDPTGFFENAIDANPSNSVFLTSPTITQTPPTLQISLNNSPQPIAQSVLRTFVSPSPLIHSYTLGAHHSLAQQSSAQPSQTQHFPNTEQDERQEVQRIKEQLLSDFPVQLFRSPVSSAPPSPAQFQQPSLVPPTQPIAQGPLTQAESRPSPPTPPKSASPVANMLIPSSLEQSALNGLASVLPAQHGSNTSPSNRPQASPDLSTNGFTNSAQADAATPFMSASPVCSSASAFPLPTPISTKISASSQCSTSSSSPNSNPAEYRVVSTSSTKLRIKLSIGPSARPEFASSSPTTQRQLVASSPLVSAPGPTASSTVSPSIGEAPNTTAQTPLPPVAFYNSAEEPAAATPSSNSAPPPLMQSQFQPARAAPKKRRAPREPSDLKNTLKKRVRSSLSDSESVSSDKEFAARTEQESAELAMRYSAECVDVTQRLGLRRTLIPGVFPSLSPAAAGAGAVASATSSSIRACAALAMAKHEPIEEQQHKPRKVAGVELTREQRRERRHAQSLLFQVSQQSYSNEALLESFDNRLSWLIHNSSAAANASSSQFTLRSLHLGVLSISLLQINFALSKCSI